MGIKRFILFVMLLGLASMVPGSLDFGPQAAGKPHPVVSFATRSATTAPLREMPEPPALPDVIGEIFEKPLKRLPNRAGGGGAAPDPVAQIVEGSVAAVAIGAGFEGIGIMDNTTLVLPPDTVGAIGPKHYVQMVNLSFAVWLRNPEVDPLNFELVLGPFDNSRLWQNFGGPCEKTNDGDPIVLYDHLADRWLMSQFALPRFPRGPFYQCIAVSQGPDPTGAWHLYEFKFSQSKLNDYPKFGLWPDGYYMAVNQFQCSIFGCSWGGQGVVAFERSKMLSGENARMVYFDLESVDSSLGGMLPADLDGPPPPAGAPNPFAQIDDDVWFGDGRPDQLQIWNFHVDWDDPGRSTFEHDVDVETAAFDSNLCGYARNCIPQPSDGTNVDALSDRLMYRLQYRNFGDAQNSDQTLIVNHTVDVDGNDHAGVRWYELNDSGSGWTMAQEGTYAPDPDHRWMGSAAMNGAGDIALGYSVSSGVTFPSIRFTGRLDTDIAPLGEMTIAEGEIIAGGGGVQTHSSGRWGDYSMLTVDPRDDCTFWYTQEYYAEATNFSAEWRTRIGSFKLADCAPVVNNPNNPPTANDDFPITNEDTAVTIDVLSNDSDPDLDTLSVASVTQGSNGLVTNNGANVTYTPNPDYYGLDSFTYTDSDGNGGTSPPATVTVTVTPVNDAPVAGDDTYGVNENDTLSVDAPGVLADDNDVEGDSLTAVWVSGPSNGGLTLNSDGSFDYTPNPNFTGDDSFIYTADDGTEISNEATVTITVTPVGGGTTMHVGDLDGRSAFSGRRGNKWIATVTVTVYDETEALVAGATVSGDWSAAAKGSGSCTTDASGMCEVSKGGLKLTATMATFTVTAVTHASLAYDGDANHDGTSFTVNLQ